MTSIVIITDDDPTTLLLHKIAAKKSGLSDDPICFSNAPQTLEYLKKHHKSDNIYLMLLDINMDPMGAWELLDVLNTFPDDYCFRILVASASIDEADHQKSKQYRHVVGYLEKPVTVNDLRMLQERGLFSGGSAGISNKKFTQGL